MASPAVELAWEASVKYPRETDWELDGWCHKHLGWHLQNSQGGTPLVAISYNVGMEAVRLLNENPPASE